MEVTMRVAGGLPITVDVSLDGPDPSVGIFGYSLLDWTITEIAGRPVRKGEKTEWIARKLTASDFDTMVDKACEAMQDAADDAAISRAEYERDYY